MLFENNDGTKITHQLVVLGVLKSGVLHKIHEGILGGHLGVNTVQSTYNFTHMWHFLCGATHDCDTFPAALQCGPHQLLRVGHTCGISYCLPRVAYPCLLLSLVFLALLYMYDVIYCIHVYFTYFLCLAKHGMALITSVLLRQLAWRKISASNAYTCTILLYCHALYSIIILTYTNITIAFTCRSEKNSLKNQNS